MKPLSQTVQFLIKFFFIGLLLQFFLHTFVTYKLGREGGIWNWIWLWKEVLIAVFLLIVGVFAGREVKKQGIFQLFTQSKTQSRFRFFVFFLLLCGVSFLLAVGAQKVGLWAYILSVKYNILGFLIFLIGAGLSRFLPLQANFNKRYTEFLKWIIYGAMCRWAVIVLLPSFLKLFGYSRDSFEGTLSSNPPAVYYTQINQGLARNQFVFERPIGFGFFLVAFWPLFVLTYLRKQSRKTKLLWTIAFGAVVLSTYSRAAMGARVLQTGILILLLYPKQAKKLIVYGGIPAAVLMVLFFFQFKSIFSREHSNTGHAKLLIEGINIGMQKPFLGRGAGYSGPASHQLCLNTTENPRCQLIQEVNEKYSMQTPGYNPENQYVQIFMEYGLLGLIPWLLCFGRLLRESLKHIFTYLSEIKKGKKADQKLLTQSLTAIAFGIGLFGLAVEGMMLHSFVDRMIVYPFMLLRGLRYGKSLYQQESLEKAQK